MSKVCKACGADSFLKYKAVSDHQYNAKETADYYECHNCHHLFVSPDFTDQQIASFYDSYSTHVVSHKKNSLVILWRNINEAILSLGLISLQRETAKRLDTKEYEGRKIKLLDVGCGSGEFLANTSVDKNVTAYGVDFDQKALEAARGRGLTNISQKSVSELSEKFDVITLNHVIEHIQNITSFKNDLIKISDKNGVIIFRTPNAESFCSCLFKENWRGLESPRHLNVFTKASARAFFKDFETEVTTSNAMLFPIWIESCKHSLEKNLNFNQKLSMITALLIFPVTTLLSTLVGLMSNTGEELIIKVKIRK